MIIVAQAGPLEYQLMFRAGGLRQMVGLRPALRQLKDGGKGSNDGRRWYGECLSIS